MHATVLDMIQASCHCGAVTIEVARLPDTLTNCDCSICRRYATLWAYYSREDVSISAAPGATLAYAWGARSIQFVRCTTCGCVTHWEPRVAERGPRIGVNARLFQPSEIATVRIRRLDGAVTEKYLD